MREYLLVFLIAASTTYLLSGVCRQIAMRVGAVASVRDRDVHTVPIPYFGGIAMLLGVCAAIQFASNLPWLGQQEVVIRDTRGVLAACLVMGIVGAIDDLLDLPALIKASGQMVAAGVAVVTGVRIYWIPLPNRVIVLDTATSILMTLLLIFICVNAINFIDGLDGLAAGVVGISALAFFTYSYFLAYENSLARATAAGIIAISAAGVCAGFLPHNFHRAKMFMGDSGALLLGMLMVSITISFTGQIDPAVVNLKTGGRLASVTPVILPLLILFIPLLDLVQVYFRRTMAGKWWFVADKQHLHHQILRRGHSQIHAVLLMYLWSFVLGFGSVGFGLSGNVWVLVAMIIGIVIAASLTIQRPRFLFSKLITEAEAQASQEHNADVAEMREVVQSHVQHLVAERNALIDPNLNPQPDPDLGLEQVTAPSGSNPAGSVTGASTMSFHDRPQPSEPIPPADDGGGRWRKKLFISSTAAMIAVAAVLAAISWSVASSQATRSVLIGFAIVAIFYWSGAIFQLWVMMSQRRVHVVWLLTTYLIRVGLVLGIFALLMGTQANRYLSTKRLGIAAVACVMAWLAGTVIGHRRARIPVYDFELLDAGRLDSGGEGSDPAKR